MRCSSSILLLAVWFLGCDQKPNAKSELKRLQGVWQIKAVEKDGVTVNPLEGKWVIEENKYTLKITNQIQEGTIEVEPDKNPNAINMLVASGPDKGLTYRGIYKFLDGELLICFPKDNECERPTDFSGNAGNGQTLTVLKRKKS